MLEAYRHVFGLMWVGKLPDWLVHWAACGRVPDCRTKFFVNPEVFYTSKVWSKDGVKTFIAAMLFLRNRELATSL